MFLYEIHKTLYKEEDHNFSTLFLNAGAHIQHHYFLIQLLPIRRLPVDWYINENDDPILEMLKVYDEIINDLLDWPNTEILIATGLSQKHMTKLNFTTD